MILLNHIQPVTQVVETPSPPSPIQCCIVLLALVFTNLVETFFQHCLVGEGGRQLYRQCFNKVTLIVAF